MAYRLTVDHEAETYEDLCSYILGVLYAGVQGSLAEGAGPVPHVEVGDDCYTGEDWRLEDVEGTYTDTQEEDANAAAAGCYSSDPSQ